MLFFTALSIAFFMGQNANAQINFGGGTYTQDFDGLANSGSGVPWTNNITLPGWFLFRQPAPGTAITTYTTGTGTSATGSFYSFGIAADRALGGVGSGGTYFGSPGSSVPAGWISVGFTNTTGSTINTATIGFDGEQWRNGGNTTPQTMVFEYGFGATFETVTTWTAPGNDFDWTSVVNLASSGPVDGNAAGVVAGRGGVLSALNWANGETLFLRWIENNDASTDHGLAIDNFSLTAFGQSSTITFGGGTYKQDFNTLATTGTANTWENNSTIPGWFLFRQPAPGTAITAYAAGTGSSNTGSFYSFGASGNSERALGGVGSGGGYFGSPSSGNVAGWIAVCFTKTSGSTINSATVGFDGEQWRNGGNTTAQTMVFEYGFGATFEAVPLWTAPGNNFDWTSIVNTGTSAPIDGNATGLVAGRGGELTALNWANGQTIFFRWREVNDAGNDHGLAIDNFSLSTGGVALPTVSVEAVDNEASEAPGNTGLFRFSRTGATAAPLTINYSLTGSTASAADYNPALSGTIIIGVGEASADVTITPVDDADIEGTESIVVTLTGDAAYQLGATATTTATVSIFDNDIAITKIHTIQGNNSTQLPNITGSGAHNDRSPLEGQSVAVQGIVTAVYNDLNAFFMQEEDADADADPSTSEGIFVFTNDDPAVAVGDLVKVTGAVDEFFGMTQLDSDNGAILVEVISSGNPLPTAVVINLPIAAGADVDDFYEQYEGMLVKFGNKMVVADHNDVPRFGLLRMTADTRDYQFTHNNLPSVTGNAAYEAELSRKTILLDDESNIQNDALNKGFYYYPQPGGFGAGTQGTDFYRAGDAVNDLTGVLHWSFSGAGGTDAWRIRPVAFAQPTFTAENARPTAPAAVGGNIKVAAFNVLNYFTTLNQRGANSTAELTRQTNKLVPAIMGLGADVVGLVEIENNNNAALIAVVNALNAVAGAGTWAYIPTGTVGTDQITCAVIYKPAVVSPEGTVAILTDPSFTNPNGLGGQQNRPAIAASFKVTDAGNPDVGGIFTLVINHLKSKGGSGSGADADLGDGQAQFNSTRTKAAAALATWLATDPTGVGDADYLIMGDLNAYKKEDPIMALKNAGYTDLIEQFGGNTAYGYLFGGTLGYLDHALANNSLLPQVKGVTEWHINADEMTAFDYNDEIRDAGEQSFDRKPTGNTLFEANPFRTSDHDPVLVGLDLVVPCKITCPENIVVSNDPGVCGAVVSYTVTSTGDCNGLTYSHASGSLFPVGTTTVTVTANSGETCSFTITVNDTEAPVITTTTQPIVMSGPPNHNYVSFAVSQFVTAVSANCTNLGIADVRISKVTSDEAENGDDDGNTIDDIVIGADCQTVMLRRERNGMSNGRVYTLHFTVTDEAGNVGMATATVQVRLSNGQPMVVADAPQYEVSASCNAARLVVKAKAIANLNENASSLTLSAYPNPANGQVMIQYQLHQPATVSLQLMDASGNMAMAWQEGMRLAGTYQKQLSTNALASGLYLVQVLAADGGVINRQQTRIVIIR